MGTEERMTIGETRALAAERLLERKRISLESAIEALETVGYHVHKNEFGKYRVIQPCSVFDESNAENTFAANSRRREFLGEYPPVLTVKGVAEILGISGRTVTRLCASNQLPSFKIGNSVRISKVALIEHMTKQAG